MPKVNSEPRDADLRVWHIPQVPGEPFYVPVETPDEAIKLLHVLADYDLFQLQQNIKPDYSNVQGLEVFEEGGWCEWYDDDTGEDIREYAESQDELAAERAAGIARVIAETSAKGYTEVETNEGWVPIAAWLTKYDLADWDQVRFEAALEAILIGQDDSRHVKRWTVRKALA